MMLHKSIYIKKNLSVSAFVIMLSLLIHVIGISGLFRKVFFDQNTTPYLGAEMSIELYANLTKGINSSLIHKTLHQNIIAIDVSYANREEISQVLSIVNKCNAKVIGLDVRFLHPKSFSIDSQLVHSLSHDNIILPIAITYSGKGIQDGSFFYSTLKNPCYGIVSLVNNNNGVFDDFCVEGVRFKSFSYAIASKFTNRLRLSNYNSFRLINYNRHVFRIIDYEDVLSCSYNNFFNDKIVIIGGLTDSRDIHNTYNGDMAGMLIHCHAVACYLSDDFIQVVPHCLVFIFSAILLIIFSIIDSFIRRGKYVLESVALSIFEMIFMYGIIYVFAVVFRTFNIYIDAIDYFIMVTLYMMCYSSYDKFILCVKKVSKRFPNYKK